MIILGIDPGLSGAVAGFDDGRLLWVYDIPIFTLERGGKNKREVDIQQLADEIILEDADHAWLEQVGAMPGQGVTSMFAFGQTFGIIKGILAAKQIPMTLVTPQKWKGALKVPKDKDGARARASQLMPGDAASWRLKKHDGRAEAALIGYYGVTQQVQKELW